MSNIIKIMGVRQNGRMYERSYDVSDIDGVERAVGNSTFDLVIKRPGGRTQHVDTREGFQLWRRWKGINRCESRCCFMRRESDTPGDCAFCQHTECLEDLGYRTLRPERLPVLRRVHGVIAVLSVALALSLWHFSLSGQQDRDNPPPAKTVSKSHYNKKIGDIRQGREGGRNVGK